MGNGVISSQSQNIITISAFGDCDEIVLDISSIKKGEGRFLEARVVNGATYSDLEYSFNEGYREARKHLSTIMFQKAMSKKAINKIKSESLIDEYPAFLKETRMKDCVAIRDAFLQRNESYVKATDRLALLEATECWLEGKVKVFENVCRYMRKEMDMQIRSGAINNNKY